MNQNRIKYLLLSFLSLSPFVHPKNKNYANDYLSLNKVEYAKKYLTLFNSNNIDFSKIRENKAYLSYQNNDSFQIVVFSRDHYTYCSSLMPSSLLKNLPKQKLFRSDYFTIENEILRLESINVNIQPIIEEGIIEKDTIFMNKKYNANKTNKTYSIKSKYVLMPEIIVYNFNDFIVIETKK